MMRFLACFFVLALCMLDVAMHAQTTILAIALGAGIPAALAALYAVATKCNPAP